MRRVTPAGRSDPRALRLARGLGWFSIALGLSEIFAPKTLSRVLGMESPKQVRSFGFRELGTGAGILWSQRMAPWLWGRLAGDVQDLRALSSAYRSPYRSVRRNVATALIAVAGVTLLDALAAHRLTTLRG